MKKKKKRAIVSNGKDRERRALTGDELPGQPYPLAGSPAALYRSRAAAGAVPSVPLGAPPAGRWPRPGPAGCGLPAAPRDSPAGIRSRSKEPRWASPEGPTAAAAAERERKGRRAGERGKGSHHRSALTWQFQPLLQQDSSVFIPCHLGQRRKKDIATYNPSASKLSLKNNNKKINHSRSHSN